MKLDDLVVSHLLFADDLMVFAHANRDSALAIKDVVDGTMFWAASQQLQESYFLWRKGD